MFLHIRTEDVEGVIRKANAAGMHKAAAKILESARQGSYVIVDVDNEKLASVVRLAKVVGGEAGELINNQVQAVKTEDW